MRGAAFFLILSTLLLVRSSAAAPAAPDDTNGSYRLVFKGCYSGMGKATVTPKDVTIKGSLFDEGGNAVDFDVPKIAVQNHRFNSDVGVGGRIINISGRVDPSGGALRKARITFTFGSREAGFGRATGEHN